MARCKEVRSPVGAGDSFLARMVPAPGQAWPIEEALRFRSSSDAAPRRNAIAIAGRRTELQDPAAGGANGVSNPKTVRTRTESLIGFWSTRS